MSITYSNLRFSDLQALSKYMLPPLQSTNMLKLFLSITVPDTPILTSISMILYLLVFHAKSKMTNMKNRAGKSARARGASVGEKDAAQ